jgi:esterase
MQLAYKRLGQGQPLLILHGLYGSSDNWYSIGKELSLQFDVILVDLRNHGRSPHSDVHTYSSMQADILDMYETLGISKAIIMGHSMGGKTAMLFSLLHPEKVDKLIIVDIGPKPYTSLQNYQSNALEHLNIMQAFLSVDISNMTKREEIDAEFAKYIPNSGTRQFLLKNASRTAEGFRWILNVEVLSKSLPNILESIKVKNLIDASERSFPTLFIKGEKSDYILDTDLHGMKQLFPKAELVTIFDAGHWVHAEQPQLFLKTINYFLDQN